MPNAYGTRDDFEFYARAIDSIPSAFWQPVGRVERMIETQSRVIDRDLRRRAVVPLAEPYSLDIVRDVCILAEYDIMGQVGFRDDDEAEQLRQRYLDVVARHPGIADEGEENAVSDGDTTGVGGPDVYSEPPRGW